MEINESVAHQRSICHVTPGIGQARNGLMFVKVHNMTDEPLHSMVESDPRIWSQDIREEGQFLNTQRYRLQMMEWVNEGTKKTHHMSWTWHPLTWEKKERGS